MNEHPIGEVAKFISFLATGFISLAIISVVLSRSSATASLIQTVSAAYNSLIAVILAPASSNH